MAEKHKRGYRKKGLRFENLEFKNQAELSFVQANTKRIASKMRDFRKAKKLSQEELAELVLVSVSTIKFIEQNQRTPSLPMLFKILYVLDRNALIWP